MAERYGSHLRALSARRAEGPNSPLRLILEKEILHHELLASLGEIGALRSLVFKGGTCLRICHNGKRFSEDLDFSGGAAFDPGILDGLEHTLSARVERVFGVEVALTPARVAAGRTRPGDVTRWRVQVATEPERRRGRVQKIRIDIDRRNYTNTMSLKPGSVHGNLTGPRGGYEVTAATVDAIRADKAVALAASVRDREHPRYRDLWDLGWHRNKGTKAFDSETFFTRLSEDGEGAGLFDAAIANVEDIVVSPEFADEMARFLPPQVFSETIGNPQRRSTMAVSVARMLKHAKALAEAYDGARGFGNEGSDPQPEPSAPPNLCS